MMDKVQKHISFNTNTPSSESYKNESTIYLSSSFGMLMAIHSMKRTKCLARQVDFASWKWVFPHSIKVIFGQKANISIRSSTVFAWFCPMQLFMFPKLKILKVFLFYTTWRYSEWCDYSTETTFRRWFTAMFSFRHNRDLGCLYSQVNTKG
jgi:hypothetical protein